MRNITCVPKCLFLIVCCSAAIVGSLTSATAVAQFGVTPEQREKEQREKIEAIPSRAVVPPAKPRKLLIFDLNVGYGGHGSIPTANLAFTLMGQKTGAFQTVVSRDPAVFQPDSLRQFDAVFLNNNVGNLFEDPSLRQSLVEFVYGGGGLMGVHGTTVAFTRWTEGAREDWPEFGIMLGGRGAAHKAADEHVFIKLDEPAHPLNQVFGGQGFEYRSEFFRVHDPYSRDRVRVLFSIDTQRTDMSQTPNHGGVVRTDDDYALAWVRNYGRGRVFYCTIGHQPAIFWDPNMLQFYLAAAQFADKTAELGLPYMGGLSFQKVSADIPKNFDPQLTDDELRQIRLKLDAAGVRMLTYYFQAIPGDPDGCRRVFEFGRKIGIETFMSEPAPEALDTIERFCDEYEINVALHNHDQQGSPHYWNPEGILKACEGRSRRIGACADLGYWMRAGIDPIQAAGMLKDRLLTLQIHDLNERTAAGHDVPWGTGAGQTELFLKEIRRLGIQPAMFGLEYSYNWFESMPEIAKSIQFFDRVTQELAVTQER